MESEGSCSVHTPCKPRFALLLLFLGMLGFYYYFFWRGGGGQNNHSRRNQIPAAGAVARAGAGVGDSESDGHCLRHFPPPSSALREWTKTGEELWALPEEERKLFPFSSLSLFSIWSPTGHHATLPLSWQEQWRKGKRKRKRKNECEERKERNKNEKKKKKRKKGKKELGLPLFVQGLQ